MSPLDGHCLLCFTIASALAVMSLPSLVLLFECRSALADDRRAPPPQPVSFTIVIAAYLPNEQAIILDTLRHFAAMLAAGDAHALLLAYNTSVDLPIECGLHDAASMHPGCRVLRVEASHSKAANLNAAMAYVTTDAVAFFDCDSRPEPGCLRRAAAWLASGYDTVQGVNLPRASDGWLARLVYTECLIKYLVSYRARFRSTGVVYFTGSNGYWRSSLVRSLMFRDGQQVEDIDLSMRAILAGARMAYDPAITAFDEPPPTLRALWTQRVRWAQGWAQLLRCHQKAVLLSAVVRGRRRAVWTYFLLFKRLIMPLCLIIAATGAVAQAVLRIAPTRAEAAAALALYLTGLAAASASLWVLQRKQQVARGQLPLPLYPVLFPFYDFIRELTVVRGSVALFAHPRAWRVTPRRISNPVNG